MDHTGTDDPGPEEEARQGKINMLQIWVLKQGDVSQIILQLLVLINLIRFWFTISIENI